MMGFLESPLLPQNVHLQCLVSRPEMVFQASPPANVHHYAGGDVRDAAMQPGRGRLHHIVDSAKGLLPEFQLISATSPARYTK